MVSLDHIGTLFCNHVYYILDATICNAREAGSVDYTKVLNAVYLQVWVNDALFDVFAGPAGAARMKAGL